MHTRNNISSKLRIFSFGSLFLTLIVGTVSFQGCGTRTIEKKTDDQVFGKWMKTQQVFNDQDLEGMNEHLSPAYVSSIKTKYAEMHTYLEPIKGVVETIYNTKIPGGPETFNITLTDGLKDKLGKLYAMMDHDMPSFIEYLKNLGLATQARNDADLAGEFKDIIKQCRGLTELFFAQPNARLETDYMRAVGNRFFEFCFSPQTWPLFEEIINKPELHPLGRILYATIWYYLAGNGWKHWNSACLDELKKEAGKGKKIVYIAGGSDVFQMISRGIYNIEVIDPILPSQPKYYSEGWDWLVKPDGLGDEVTFTAADKNIYMKRTNYTENGTFKARLVTDVIADIPNSITEWTIYAKDTNKQLGIFTISRRFCTQKDFFINAQRAMVTSFNELYFLVSPNPQKSWGINPELFDSEYQIYVKQLREPVTLEEMFNMRRTEQSDFSFIALGTEIN